MKGKQKATKAKGEGNKKGRDLKHLVSFASSSLQMQAFAMNVGEHSGLMNSLLGTGGVVDVADVHSTCCLSWML